MIHPIHQQPHEVRLSCGASCEKFSEDKVAEWVDKASANYQWNSVNTKEKSRDYSI